MQRRAFLRKTASGLFLAGAAPFVLGQQPSRYKAALIGCGWWGKNILREAIASGRVKVVGLCDVDASGLEVSAEQITEASGDAPKIYKHHRELLEKEKPDIVVIASPDHWHALHTIDSLKAGAHVFVEKPTGHTVNESRAMLRASRDAGRVVQVGLHRRIGPHHVSGLKFLKDGGAGKIGHVRMFVAGGGGPEKPTPNSAPPKGMNWDLYCGPAPLRPFCTRIHPGGFRNFLDFANGTLGDWGVHWIDQVLAWTEETHPRRVFSSGGRPVRGPAVLNEKEQTSDAPDHQVATFEFETFTATWEHRSFAGKGPEKHGVGCYFYGSKGVFHMGWRDGWTFYPADGKQAPVHEASQLQEPDGHNLKLLWADFLDAVETKRRPVAGIEAAHRSTTAVLLAMASLKAGRSVVWDGAKAAVVGDPEIETHLRRKYREPWTYP
ncbi:MAG TPA: Gfo/Idh/MocA family oxidoreductase [Planctomycetota bacterium]|nr:Gfo/Idh/MocA family oxidoreductase [Planctomycetota bacterium]